LHIHVRKGDTVAKFWLEPEPGVARAYGMSAHELHELLDVAVEHKEEIKRYWNEHFSS
jgi:alkanesulfonate monooxygenase SsuD/methylene tetrahydromethanopterin reductase-like flavin-dependent oxidoreductase (luciferase family)